MNSDFDNIPEIPEISVKVYKYELLNTHIYVILRTDQVEYFRIFIEKLKSMEDWNISKKELAIDFLKLDHKDFEEYFSRIPEWSHDSVFRSVLGSLSNTLDKLEPLYIGAYTSYQRNKLIDDITKD